MVNFFLKKELEVHKLDEDYNQRTNRYTQSSLMHGLGLVLKHINPARIFFYDLIDKIINENSYNVNLPTTSDLLRTAIVKEMIEIDGFFKEEVEVKIYLTDYLLKGEEEIHNREYYNLILASYSFNVSIDDCRGYKVSEQNSGELEELKEKIIILDWRQILELGNELLKKNLISGLERVLISDYLLLMEEELFTSANQDDDIFAINKDLFEKINGVFNEWDPLNMTAMTLYEYEDYAWGLVKKIYCSERIRYSRLREYLAEVSLFQSYFAEDKGLLEDITEKTCDIAREFQREVLKQRR